MRRQCDPVDVVRGLFNSKSRRNLSTASVLHIDKKTVDGRDGFLTWLKDIFNKSIENKSYKADIMIVDRIPIFNRPKIATSMRPVDSSNKVEVINQKLANFCATQSMTKFEYRNTEKSNAKNDERAYTVRRSAIYATSQSSFATGKTSERQIALNPSCHDPGKMYRSEKNGGAIEFAARDDLDVVSHYRCYTSPRHCYRLPPQRTKQPALGLCVPNRYINVPTRAIVGFAPRNSKPPVKEPNASEKREKKDEKKDRKEKKKPVIRTGGESASVDSENRVEMVADDNPRSDPDATFRYEWGVKLAEEQLAGEAANDNDKFGKKGQRYVTNRLWGVNLKQPKPDIDPLATTNSGRGTEMLQNASSIFKSGKITADEAKSGVGTAPNNTTEKSGATSLKGTIAECLSTPSCQTGSSDDFNVTSQNSRDASLYLSSKDLRKILKTSPNMLREATVVDKEFNIPEDAGLNTEIAAWQNLMKTSTPVKENYLNDNVENMEIMSIRPEAPQPKLDVQVVKSIEDNLKQSDSEYTSPKSIEIKRVGSPRKPDSYSIGKKFHTMSTQIHHVHTDNITQRHIELLSSNFAFIDKAKMKCPGFVSAFCTNPKDSMPKMIDETPNHQGKQQMDSKSQNSNLNILNSNRSLLLTESQTSSSDQEQADTDFAKTLDVIANKEMEISMNQQSTDDKKIIHVSNSVVSSEFTQKDKSHYKNEKIQDKIKHYEEPHVVDLHDEEATYVDFNNQSTDNGSIKLASKSVKEDSRSKDDNNVPTFDSKIKDVDDSSNEYVIDGNYVRIPGDPYPYSKENLDKWRVPRSKNLINNPWKRKTSCSSGSPTVVRSTLRNANDAYANAAGEPRDSHASKVVMETSGSGDNDGASARKRMGQANVSSRDQRVVFDCLRGDAADALGLRQ